MLSVIRAVLMRCPSLYNSKSMKLVRMKLSRFCMNRSFCSFVCPVRLLRSVLGVSASMYPMGSTPSVAMMSGRPIWLMFLGSKVYRTLGLLKHSSVTFSRRVFRCGWSESSAVASSVARGCSMPSFGLWRLFYGCLLYGFWVSCQVFVCELCLHVGCACL